jgi:hypothetical protein
MGDEQSRANTGLDAIDISTRVEGLISSNSVGNAASCSNSFSSSVLRVEYK